MTLNTKRRLIALVITIVMAFSLVLPMASASGKLATPVLIPKGEVQIIENVGVGNSALHASSRSLIYEPIDGATGYNVYVFATLADAKAGTHAIAVSKNAQATAGSDSAGGTTNAGTVSLEDGESMIDVRLLQYEDIVEGSTRTLPAGYMPAGIGDTWMPAGRQGDQTNLKPGQYWFRMSAVDAADASKESDMSDLYEDEHPYTIAVGPDEGRDLMEEALATKVLGDTLFIIDLRGAAEFSDEGVLRFSSDYRHPHTDFNTTEKAEALFGHANDKSAVTFFVF